MTARRSFLWLARTALVAFSVTMGFVGCSRQSEGERCDKAAAGDTDCNDGLVCVECEILARGSVDRCCPADQGASSDPDCKRADPPRTQALECNPMTGGTGGFGARDGGAGMSGGGTGGNATSGTGGTAGSSGGEGGA